MQLQCDVKRVPLENRVIRPPFGVTTHKLGTRCKGAFRVVRGLSRVGSYDPKVGVTTHQLGTPWRSVSERATTEKETEGKKIKKEKPTFAGALEGVAVEGRPADVALGSGRVAAAAQAVAGASVAKVGHVGLLVAAAVARPARAAQSVRLAVETGRAALAVLAFVAQGALIADVVVDADVVGGVDGHGGQAGRTEVVGRRLQRAAAAAAGVGASAAGVAVETGSAELAPFADRVVQARTAGARVGVARGRVAVAVAGLAHVERRRRVGVAVDAPHVPKVAVLAQYRKAGLDQRKTAIRSSQTLQICF